MRFSKQAIFTFLFLAIFNLFTSSQKYRSKLNMRSFIARTS